AFLLREDGRARIARIDGTALRDVATGTAGDLRDDENRIKAACVQDGPNLNLGMWVNGDPVAGAAAPSDDGDDGGGDGGPGTSGLVLHRPDGASGRPEASFTDFALCSVWPRKPSGPLRAAERVRPGAAGMIAPGATAREQGPIMSAPASAAPPDPAETTRPSAPPAIAWRPVLLIAGVLGVVLLAVSARYGYHRDELYFRVAGRHPMWGYPDQPPLVPLLGRAVTALSDTLVALRVPAALFSAA